MRIVMLGAPGSGKGTQAELLVREFGMPHISSGDLLRAAAKAGTELGLKAREYMDRGELIPDDVMIHLIGERLGQDDTRNGFILDGYPRDLVQARALDDLLGRLGAPLNDALQIDVDAEQAIARIMRRAEKEHRSDDREEVARNRMQVYEEQTAPVVDYYADRGILTRILGTGSAEEVFQRIKGALQARSGP